MSDPLSDISELDLCAYVDGELDDARRLDVEEYLSRHPAIASEVMADLLACDRVRLAAALDTPEPAARNVALARGLHRRLTFSRLAARVPRASFALLIATCAWLSADEIGDQLAPQSQAATPYFIDEAMEAYDTARLRHAIQTETASAGIDLASISEATGIAFPAVSSGLRIMDAGLVSTDGGTGVEMLLDAGHGEPLTLFAVRTNEKAPTEPMVLSFEEGSVAYWRRGAIGYALTGTIPADELDRLADDIADNPVN